MLVPSGFQPKVLTILILSIWFAPMNYVEGLQCLSCSTEEKTSNYNATCGTIDPEKTEDCPANALGCSFTVEPVEKYIRRECMSTAYVTCSSKIFNKALVDGECVMFRNLTASAWEKFTECESELSKGGEDGSPAAKETIQQGPGSRADITRMEICFCQGDKCNTNAIKPKSAVISDEVDVGGTGTQLGSCLLLTLIASGLGFMYK